jgi:hypothetical protein
VILALQIAAFGITIPVILLAGLPKEAAIMDSRLKVARDEMLRRISGEYLEMPGLRLTCEQAQRLWGIDRETCRGLLDELVASRFLGLTRDGQYTRLAEDRMAALRPRMAQATLAKAFEVKRVS